jgi:hypothetical protein
MAERPCGYMELTQFRCPTTLRRRLRKLHGFHRQTSLNRFGAEKWAKVVEAAKIKVE